MKSTSGALPLIDCGGRRIGMERRSFSYSGHIPERRSGEDRRQAPDRRSGLDRRDARGRRKVAERGAFKEHNEIPQIVKDVNRGFDRRSGRDRRVAFM